MLPCQASDDWGTGASEWLRPEKEEFFACRRIRHPCARSYRHIRRFETSWAYIWRDAVILPTGLFISSERGPCSSGRLSAYEANCKRKQEQVRALYDWQESSPRANIFISTVLAQLQEYHFSFASSSMIQRQLSLVFFLWIHFSQTNRSTFPTKAPDTRSDISRALRCYLAHKRKNMSDSVLWRHRIL